MTPEQAEQLLHDSLVKGIETRFTCGYVQGLAAGLWLSGLISHKTYKNAIDQVLEQITKCSF